MNIIIDKKESSRMMDGINEILKLDDVSFQEVISLLSSEKEYLEDIVFYYTTDNCERPSGTKQIGLEKKFDENHKYIGRTYYGVKNYSISEIFSKIKNIMTQFKKESKEYSRLEKILNTRNVETLKSRICLKYKVDRTFVDKLFEIISDDQVKEKFLDYSNNSEYFSINGEQIEISEYLKILGKIFGDKDEEGKFNTKLNIENDFYIPETDDYKRRYSEIFESINMDRYVKPEYEFRGFLNLDRYFDQVIRKEDEPDWNINESLYDAVLKDMPQNFSVEEKAMYIYCKLCNELSYDNGYFYRNRLGENRYTNKFEKENLEEIKPGDKVTCWDFARIYTKFINQLNENIEAVIISEGQNKGHFLTGIYTDNVSVMLEAINGKTYGTNDLMKAKNAIEFEGLEIISDRKGLIKKALEKVYPMIFGKKQLSLQDYIQELSRIEIEERPNDFKGKLQSALEIIKQKNISGNEATQTLAMFSKSGFFGVPFERAYVGKKIIQNGKETYKRFVLLRCKDGKEENDIYIIDTDSLELSKENKPEIIKKIKNGEFVYEDNKHKIVGIDIGG